METDRARDTHFLEIVQRGTCQDTERQKRKGHSLSEDSRGRELLSRRKKPAKQGALTSWRPQGQSLVRIRKENDRVNALTSWRPKGGLVMTWKQTIEQEVLTL